MECVQIATAPKRLMQVAKEIARIPCRYSRLTTDYEGNAELVLSIPPDSRYAARQLADEVKQIDKPLELVLSEQRKRRSLDSNAYFWTLAGKLSSALKIKTEDIYRGYIKNIGDNFEIVPIRDDAKNKWMQNWSKNGIGWVCEELGTSKLPGYTNLICYYGSSTYDASQMSMLIELVIQDCKDQGIQTATPLELERMHDDWAKKQAG